MNPKLLLLHEKTICLAEGGVQEQADYEELVELREQVLCELALQAELSEPERQLVRSIAANDALIRDHMTAIQEETSMKLTRISQFKRQKTTYEHGYSEEGFIIDRRE